MHLIKLSILASLVLCSINARANVTLDCVRPVEPVFDHAGRATAKTVEKSADTLNLYTIDVKIYVKCLQAEIFNERDRLLETLKNLREQNKRYRETLDSPASQES